MKNIKQKIEAIPVKDFYCGGTTSIDLEAYGDHIYVIPRLYTTLDIDDFINDKPMIKKYFLTHLGKIIIDNG